MPLYCEVCSRTFDGPDGKRCPWCRRRRTRHVEPDDLCFLTEREYIWSGMLADVLTQKNIPFMQKNVYGAGLALKMGPTHERIRFYVFYKQLAEAEGIVESLFSASDGDNSGTDNASAPGVDNAQ